ncbi:MAG: Flp pilus assembly complex ATPase component TadA [Desulfovibrionaceae bacterium]|nr:Flp pilus assembly complex ATPase component TadA [Desulfovibrionaceae bacterium]MBF0515096.1 Flp pilus assembly complex ATPase component TadA [Desulfovibrionaceae bacterium]
MLSDLSFTDLIVFPDGTARLKGCPETGQQLVTMPPDCTEETKDLPLLLAKELIERASFSCNTFRFHQHGIFYRVAVVTDIDGGQTWFLRRLPRTVPTLSSLGLPSWLCEWFLLPEQRFGLVLLAGAQACGKTTTASSLVAERLKIYGGHAVTFENPAELPLGGKWGEFGFCFQTHIKGEDDLAVHIERAHLYASPNIIYIGEIHNKFSAIESLRVALGSRQQLVIATIHGIDVVAALERLINWAQEIDAGNACENLANSLLAIVVQDLETDSKVQQFLLLPFNQDSAGVRAKLRDKQFVNLADDMRALRNRIKTSGVKGI